MQFYLAFPLALLALQPRAPGGPRRLATAAVLVIAAVTAYRAAIALSFRLPVPVFGPLDSPEMLALMTHTLKVLLMAIICALTVVMTCPHRPRHGHHLTFKTPGG